MDEETPSTTLEEGQMEQEAVTPEGIREEAGSNIQTFRPIFSLDLLDSNSADVEEETEKTIGCFTNLKEVANNNNAVLLAFVAPYAGERVSPIEEKSASIDTLEEIAIGAIIDEINKRVGTEKNLYLLLDSPGGRPDSCYKIALAFRKNFKDIIVFIPRVAASGGTLVAMTGDRIVMSDMAHLTPIDVQVPYKDERVSVNTIEEAITRLNKHFQTMLPSEAPYPYRAMTEKIDPILREDWGHYTEDVLSYAYELLKLAGYKGNEMKKALLRLIFPKHSHSFAVNKDKASEYGLNISNKDEDYEILAFMSEWLKNYFPKSGKNHFIRYILPD